jgi:hypothetical protein
MISSPAGQENLDSQSGALANLIELARLSRLTLLYHGAAASADGAREQAAALAGAAAAVAEGDVVVVFDAGSDLPVPDLLADIEAAVLEAAPQAPLAPPMAGPVEAMAFWQQALGLRFLLIVRQFDQALSRQDPEFDEMLLKLAHDALDVSVLLLMDEAAAPLLQRLRDALPELGETFLRLPEPAGLASPPPEPPKPPATPDEPVPQASMSMPRPAPAAPAARFGPSPFLLDDPDDELAGQAAPVAGDQDEMTLPAPPQPAPGHERQRETTQEQRRSRRFSTLLEQARIAPDAFEAPAEAAPEPFNAPPAEPFAASATPAPAPMAAPLQVFPASPPPAIAAPELALPDGRAEPSFMTTPAARPAAGAPGARVYRERRPMQVAAWMQKRRSRRRRSTVGMASRVGSSSTVLFVLMLMLAMLGWQMPQLDRAAAQPAQAVGNAARQRPADQQVLRDARLLRVEKSAVGQLERTHLDFRLVGR